MSHRKLRSKDVPYESQQMDEDTQVDQIPDDREDKEEFSVSLLVPSTAREKRRRERNEKTKPKEMTEEEMMDLALRLSEQEASVSARRRQQEEEAMMKAIQESMVNQTQPCLSSTSQSLLAEGGASLRLNSRRKLSYSNRKTASVINQGASQDGSTSERNMSQGDENNIRNKKRKRKESSPLLEVPDSRTQRICSQPSPPTSESLPVLLDSPQSCDSTQIEDCELRKSPVFSLTGCAAEGHIPRLSRDLLDTCRISGFAPCSQDCCTSTHKSQPSVQPKSPTFPKSPSNFPLSESGAACPRSPLFSETDQGDNAVLQLSPDCFKSPVFGRDTQQERSTSACKPPVGVCSPTSENSGFMFSPQESLTSSLMPTSCQPKSPVFPRSPGLPQNLNPSESSAFPTSPVFLETGRGQDRQTEESHGRTKSPVFGRTLRREKIHPDRNGLSRSCQRSSCSSEESWDQCLRRVDQSQDGRFNKATVTLKSDDADVLNEVSKDVNSSEMELTSDMTLHWSDNDEDVTVGSPSPVFPEEKPVHQADSQAASRNHGTAAAAKEPNRSLNSRCSKEDSSSNKLMSLGPASSSTSICLQPFPATEEELQPISKQDTASRESAPPAGTVHYFWGVPFCPRGVDADSYTQVILAQMEVYEKSLKQAQRSLLRKAEWGEAILPQPEKPSSPRSPAESSQELVSPRRDQKLRSKKLSEDAESPPAETDEEKKNEEEEGAGERKENEGERESVEEVQVDDCEVCPETQLSDDSMQGLKMAVSREAEPESPEQPEVRLTVPDEDPAVDEPPEEEEEMEVDVAVDGEVKGDVNPRSCNVGGQSVSTVEKVEEDTGCPDVEEIKESSLQRSSSPELDPVTVPQSPETKVECPICQGAFPVAEIELHAAYCDGEVAVVDEHRPAAKCYQVSLKPHRKRARRAAEETSSASNDGRIQEKCYICQKSVPLRDYSRHTETCIQQTLKTSARGTLVSALERTESRDSEAGPSGSKFQPDDVIDLRDDEDEEEEEGVSRLKISSSPIRSFTPISEAAGCLIDFKRQQRTKKPSQRRR
ncbi:uncharacterized protein uimc1 isoform 2-T2 [Aulostomus maculatus]